MSGKRRAGSQLTQDNWDDEDEPQVVEMGAQIADKSVLAKRKFKRAHRRIAATDRTDSGVKASPFGNFKGLSSAKPSTSAVKPTFGSGFQVSSTKGSLVSAFQVSSSKPGTLSLDVKTTTNPTSTQSNSEKADVKPSGMISTALNGGPNSSSNNNNAEYCSKLRALNLSVSSWIQQHVAKTPMCDLTPVFNDYRKHLAEIERKYGSSTSTSSFLTFGRNETKTTRVEDDEKKTESNSGPSQFKGFSSVPTAQSEEKSKPEEPKLQSTFFNSGGSKLTFGSSSTGFGNTGASFSFTGVTATEKKDKEEQKEASHGDDEPAKEGVKIVEEKDAIFSIRSKLYYKKDNQYKERGVGMLHLKKQDNSGQLILRADTNLGNVIFNISVPKGLPVQRQGKNNVLLMAPMNPPADNVCPLCKKKYPNPQTSNICESECTPKATAILLRVKTGADADTLKEEIEKVCE